jgi:hypothetical protein
MGSDKEELRVKPMTLYLPPILSADSARTLTGLKLVLQRADFSHGLRVVRTGILNYFRIENGV